jgi:hypothetical protein
MFANSKHLKDLAIHAIDGDIGTIDQLYFDDETWAIRYITVKTGGWLNGQQVLISPFSVTRVDWEEKRVYVALTKTQVENCPNIDTQKPVSRQHEAAYLDYFNYPYYWDGPYMWGPAMYPVGLIDINAATSSGMRSSLLNQSGDLNLHSTEAVTGYDIEASDADIGHVDGFVVDDEAWAIRYIEVATRNWLPGKKVLVSPSWIEEVSWPDSKVYVGMTAEAIKSAPEYIESKVIDREYENRLFFHYGQPPYWLNEGKYQPAYSDS